VFFKAFSSFLGRIRTRPSTLSTLVLFSLCVPSLFFP
jgi:hypothetical protein